MYSGLVSLSWVLLFAGEALASCAHGTSLHKRQEGTVEVKNFGYAGVTGPLNWISLDAGANILCATGSRQSPIDMVEGQFQLVAASTLGIQIPDFAEGTEFENLGTNVEVVAKGGSITLGGTPFNLQQFHFHLPSEHLDAGVSHAMEMHMVWESAAGQIAVVGVYIDVEGAQSAAAAAPAEAAPAEAAPAEAAPAETAPAARRRSARMAARDVAVSARQVEAPIAKRAATTLLETIFSSVDAIAQPGTVTKTQPLVMSEIVDILNAGDLQNYSGSLTTPPCSEGVTWFVSTQKLQVTAASFGRVRDVIGFNARFPQNQLGQPNILALSSAVISTPQVQIAALSQRLGVIH